MSIKLPEGPIGRKAAMGEEDDLFLPPPVLATASATITSMVAHINDFLNMWLSLSVKVLLNTAKILNILG